VTPEEERERWPEHAKLRRGQEILDRRDAAEDFVEWLSEHDYAITADLGYGEYEKVQRQNNLVIEWLAERNGVDIDKYYAEERDMIAYAIDWFSAQKLSDK